MLGRCRGKPDLLSAFCKPFIDGKAFNPTQISHGVVTGTNVSGATMLPNALGRGDELFSGKARCNECHVEPLWTEPGWNLHKAEEIGIDSFQADRAPDHAYKTQNLAGLFIRERGLFMNSANKGRFFHDGRFATLLDVVNHYNIHFNLQLTDNEKLDLVEYLKSLPEPETVATNNRQGLRIIRP